MSKSNSDRNQPLESLTTASNICEAAQEAKGFDISVLDISSVFQLSDYFVIISGRSDRHVQGVSNRIVDTMKQQNIKPIAVEGFDRGHWVLIDFGEVIVHVFYEEMRKRYDLESLWLDAQPIDTSIIEEKTKNPVAA